MAQVIATIYDLYNRIKADFESALNQSTPAIKKAFNNIHSLILAGEFGALYRFNLDQKKQCFPDSATGDTLAKWEAITNTTKKNATAAILSAAATGIDGTIVEAGLSGPRWVSDSGVLYFNTIQTPIVNGVATLIIQATEGGEIGNLDVETVLNIVSSIPGLDDKITITTINSYGQEEENESDRQKKVNSKLKNMPLGANVANYYGWALACQNIIDAYPYSGPIPGQVILYIVAGDQPDGIPTATEISTVQSYIEDPTRIPLWAEDQLPNGTNRFSVIASPILNFLISVTGLNPNTSTLITNIQNAINTFFSSRKPYIRGLTFERNADITQQKLRSIIQEQIDLYSGIGFTDVTMALDSSPTNLLTSYTLGQGTRAKCSPLARTQDNLWKMS